MVSLCRCDPFLLMLVFMEHKHLKYDTRLNADDTLCCSRSTFTHTGTCY